MSVHYAEHDLTTALGHLGLDLDGPIRIGYRAATVTAPARTQDGSAVWVRVGTVADDLVWMRPDAIEEADQALGGVVSMPGLVDASLSWKVWDEDEGAVRQARVWVFERATGVPVSTDPALTGPVQVTDEWWGELRRAHDQITRTRGAGPGQSERRVRRWVASIAGDRFAQAPIVWAPAHGDFHWANLLAPRLTILDWEAYSLAPAGYDAAMLLTYSLAAPDTAAHVREVFADVLAGEAGLLAQVFAAVEVGSAVQDGFHPHLSGPLRAHVRHLLSVL